MPQSRFMVSLAQTSLPAALEHPLDAVTEKLLTWGEAAIRHLPNVAVALLALWLSWVVGGFAARWICRGLERTSAATQLVGLTKSLTRVLAVALGVVLALNVLELDKAVATALAGVGVVGLALGFAFQDTAANLISGVFMAVKQPFRVGEVIETNGFTGTVKRVGLRATELRKFTGELVMIPNRKVFSEPLTNISQADDRRIDVAVGVSYADDLDKVERVALQAIESLSDAKHEPRPQVLYREFGGSSVDLEVRFWVPYGKDPSSYLRGRSDAIKAIRHHFEQAELTIPFPIRTLDFGIEGGKGLRAEVEPLIVKTARRAS